MSYRYLSKLKVFFAVSSCVILLGCTSNKDRAEAPLPPVETKVAVEQPVEAKPAEPHHADASHAMHHRKPHQPGEPSPYSVEVTPLQPFKAGERAYFTVNIINQDNSFAQHKDFKVTHGRRVHAMIIDPSLNDYHHLHPRPDNLNGPAIYELAFTPKQGGDYRLFLDVMDNHNKQYYLMVNLPVEGMSSSPVIASDSANTRLQQKIARDNLEFDIQSTDKFAQGQGGEIRVLVKNKTTGEPFRQLEPTMQAYAHLIGFNDERTRLIHAHPMGDEPRSTNQRGGPNLNFHIEFPEADDYRLFLQVRVNGEELFIPIDATVGDA